MIALEQVDVKPEAEPCKYKTPGMLYRTLFELLLLKVATPEFALTEVVDSVPTPATVQAESVKGWIVTAEVKPVAAFPY